MEGHTDATGNPDFNQTLSHSRALAVKRYLTERGVPPDRIEAVGLGSIEPIAPNDSPDGRAQNRRTELVVSQR